MIDATPIPPSPPVAACKPESPGGGGVFSGDAASLKRLSEYASAHGIKLQDCGSVLLPQGRLGMDRDATVAFVKKVEAGDFGKIGIGVMEAEGH